MQNAVSSKIEADNKRFAFVPTYFKYKDFKLDSLFRQINFS